MTVTELMELPYRAHEKKFSTGSPKQKNTYLPLRCSCEKFSHQLANTGIQFGESFVHFTL
jgi:hypothetical protein